MVGLWRQGRLMLESEEELNALFDHMVHDGHGGPSTPIERITAKELEPLGAGGSRVHAAFAKARLNIWRFRKCIPGAGWEVEDIWHQKVRLVLDQTMSQQPNLKDAVAVLRLVDMGEWSYSTGVQGPTLGERNFDTLQNLILASPLVDIAPTDFSPETFTKAQNLMWSRSLLRAWLRPGSVKLVTVPLETGSKQAARNQKGR